MSGNWLALPEFWAGVISGALAAAVSLHFWLIRPAMRVIGSLDAAALSGSTERESPHEPLPWDRKPPVRPSGKEPGK